MKLRLLVTSLCVTLAALATIPAATAAVSNPGGAVSQDAPTSAEGLRGPIDPTQPDSAPNKPAAGAAQAPAPATHPLTIDRLLDGSAPTPTSAAFPGLRDPGTVAVAPTESTSSQTSKDADKIPHDVNSPYRDAQVCVASQLTSEEKKFGWTVGDIPDRTGQLNAIADAGTGSFSTQAANDIMLDSLTQTGVTVVDSGAVFQQRIDWYLKNAAAHLVGDGNTYAVRLTPGGPVENIQYLPIMPGTILEPRYVVQGAISTLDFVPGGGVSGNLAIVQGQHIKTAMRIGIDMHVDQFTVGPELGGQVVAAERVEREIDAVQNQLGLSSFFRSSMYYNLTIGEDKRQALQAAEVAMFDRFAVVLVAKVNHITACDPQIAFDDRLAFSAP